MQQQSSSGVDFFLAKLRLEMQKKHKNTVDIYKKKMVDFKII